MSEGFMTDTEEGDADFSASEDEWLPEKDKPGVKTAPGKWSASGGSETDDGESDECGKPKGGGSRPKARKGRITDARYE